MKRRLSIGVSIALLATLAISGSASAAPFQNGSFENPTTTDVGSFLTIAAPSTTIAGWTVSSGSIDWVGTLWTPADGHRSIDLNGSGPGTIYQTVDTSPGHSYTVSFALSGNPGGVRGVKTVQVVVGDVTTATFSYDTRNNNTFTDMKWQAVSFTFVAKTGQTLLLFQSLAPSAVDTSASFGPAIDNVRVFEGKAFAQVSAGIGGPGAQCKNGHYRDLSGKSPYPVFKNQGQCVSYFAKMWHGGRP